MYGPGPVNPPSYPQPQYPQYPGYEYPMQPQGYQSPPTQEFRSQPFVDEFENEPPLLEELGIDLDHIYRRIQSVVFFRKIGEDLVSDLDMGGPLFIALGLGVLLVFAGKVHFGYIYGLGVLGCVGAWGLVNVMSNKDGIDLYTTMSIVGYGLLPVLFLAFFGVFMKLTGPVGIFLSIATVLWCTITASRFLECAVNMYHQRWLVAYPVMMIYICFVLITAL
jgi:hypothetical protein